MIIKDARKPSPDPVQERLRQEKAQFNKETSAFITGLINFKKLMNGQPSKFHMQKSNIKNPIPAEPISIIDALAEDFQSIAQQARNIVERQLEYSQTRRKKAPTPSPGTTPSPTTPDLTQQLIGKASTVSNPLIKFLSKYGSL